MTKSSFGRRRRHRLGVPPQHKVASVQIDHEIRKVVFVTEDVLLKQLKRDGPRIQRSFDRLAKNDLKETSLLLGQTMGLTFRHLRRLDDDDVKAVSARLLSNAISSFIASVEVARHGFRRQYGSSARQVVEAITTILYFQTKADGLETFLSGKLDSAKTIGAAKKAIPPVGQFYGLLSNEFVHIGPNHAKLEPVSEYREGEEPLSFIGATLRANAWLIYVVAELVYYDEISEHRYWRSLGKGAFEFAPSEAEITWLRQFLQKYGVENASDDE